MITYEQTVDLAELRDAVETEFGTPLALSNRVVFIHGVPEEGNGSAGERPVT